MIYIYTNILLILLVSSGMFQPDDVFYNIPAIFKSLYTLKRNISHMYLVSHMSDGISINTPCKCKQIKAWDVCSRLLLFW